MGDGFCEGWKKYIRKLRVKTVMRIVYRPTATLAVTNPIAARDLRMNNRLRFLEQSIVTLQISLALAQFANQFHGPGELNDERMRIR